MNDVNIGLQATISEPVESIGKLGKLLSPFITEFLYNRYLEKDRKKQLFE